MKQHGRNWLFALLLTGPMMLFFLGYLLHHDPALEPTGYIQYDNVSYLAYARQYPDEGWRSLFYSNPFNDRNASPAIYFQPHTLFFGILLEAGFPPGYILVPFTLLCTLLCFRLIIGIYDQLFPESKYRALSIWLFAWGGGLLAISGFFTKILSLSPSVTGIFHLDPGAGWWGLNLGRALFFSCEAYYHLLFFAVISSLLKQKWTAALLLTLLLSISHPFTGIELLCISSAWALAERFIFRNKSMPLVFIAGQILLIAFHIGYYLFYLNQFDDHRSVSEQYALNWRLRFFSMIPAYCIAGLLAIISLKKAAPPAGFFNKSYNRLFLVWFLAALALTNHELFMKPMQPLHFTRGYIWTSLFLLGLPGLHYLLTHFNRTSLQKTVLATGILLFFSDNFLWITNQVLSKATKASVSYITREQKSILENLGKRADNQALLIGADDILPYLGTVFTKARPWVSHPFTTPYAAAKKTALDLFLQTGQPDPSWKGRTLFFIFRKNDNLEMARAGSLSFPALPVLENSGYVVLEANIP